MYRKIICPVDGSDTSKRGMRQAVILAREQNASLVLLHVVDFGPLTLYGPQFGTDFEAFRDAGRATLNAAVEEAQVHDVAAEPRLTEIMNGAPGETIVREAERCGADLIVMGTHGRRGLSRLLIGSDAATVVGQSRIPVLLVK
jgi:nucleotide-binding universal stress UspA family protein